jgi:hypothetical protein
MLESIGDRLWADPGEQDIHPWILGYMKPINEKRP